MAIGAQSGLYSQTISGLASNTIYYFTAEATNVQGAGWAAPSQTFTTAATNPVSSLAAVLTFHNDNTRMGVTVSYTHLVVSVAAGAPVLAGAAALPGRETRSRAQPMRQARNSSSKIFIIVIRTKRRGQD